MKKWIWLLSLFRSWCSSVCTAPLTRYHGNSGMISMDEIKRDSGHLFWSEWEAVTKRTRNLLKRYTDHSIILTAAPVLLRDSINHQQWKNRRKNGG